MNLAILDRSLTSASEEAILDSANIIQSADVEVAAMNFLNLRNGETAAAMLAAVLVEPESWQATHLTVSEHPIRNRMRQALYPVRRQDADEIAGTVQSVWSEWVDEKLFDQVVEQAENERRLREEAEARIAAAHDKAWTRLNN